MCLSPRVTMDRSQKLINPFVSETTEAACICTVSVSLLLLQWWLTSPKFIQHLLTLTDTGILFLCCKNRGKNALNVIWTIVDLWCIFIGAIDLDYKEMYIWWQSLSTQVYLAFGLQREQIDSYWERQSTHAIIAVS